MFAKFRRVVDAQVVRESEVGGVQQYEPHRLPVCGAFVQWESGGVLIEIDLDSAVEDQVLTR